MAARPIRELLAVAESLAALEQRLLRSPGRPESDLAAALESLAAEADKLAYAAGSTSALLYLIPRERMKPQAVRALASSDLPSALVHEIQSAKASPEGQPARIEVEDAAETAVVKQLLDLARRAAPPRS